MATRGQKAAQNGKNQGVKTNNNDTPKIKLATRNTTPKVDQQPPFEFSAYNVDPDDYDLDHEQLQTLCKQVAIAVQLRQCYRIIGEQMQIISNILPKSAPLADEAIQNIEDITNWVELHKDIWENTGITQIKTT